MKNRVIGEEIEWNGGCRLVPEGPWISIGSQADKIIEEAFLNYPHCAKGTTGIFLPNGARVYGESTGQHLETAMPECLSARELLKFDKWSELFVCWAAKKLKEKYDIETVFYKKNADSTNNNSTRGCHENYFSEKKFGTWLSNSDSSLRNSISNKIPALIEPEIEYFVLFLITRQIFTGAGGIMLYSLINGKDIYEISPRTHFIGQIISPTSTSSAPSYGRPIVHFRNESLSHDDQYFRNHIILGDANMADLSTFLKFGTTSAVIEMLEEGFWDDGLRLDDVFEAPKLLRAISKDLKLNNVPIRLKNSKSYIAIQIQRKFLRNWQEYLKNTRQGGEKAEIAEKWQEVLDRLAVDDEKLYSQLDWKIKMRLIHDFMNKKGISSLNHEKVINLDKVYHSPDPEISFYYKLKNRPGAQFEELVSESEILEANSTPPENRAKLRAHLKRIFDNLGLTSNVNWDWVTFKSDDYPNVEYKIHMIDPRFSSMVSLNSPLNNDSLNRLKTLGKGNV